MPYCECDWCCLNSATIEIDQESKPPDEPTMEALLTRAESLIAELQGIIDDVRAKVASL